MKKTIQISHYIIVCLAFLLCVSCEDLQDNTPALQAELNGALFKSIGTAATINEDSTVTIQASNQDETLTLFLNRATTGNFQMGGKNSSFATFEDVNGNVYTTIGRGEGTVTVSDIDAASNISGSFQFKALLTGIDSLFAQRGIFFEVPFVNSFIQVPTEPDPGLPVGSVLARLDDELYTTTDVTAMVTDGSIVIQGIRDATVIELGIPLDAVPSINTLPNADYFAKYIEGSLTEPGLDGNIRVFDHDTSEKKIKGTFSFRTENHVISSGQFNVSY